jgi:hypothetical protein
MRKFGLCHFLCRKKCGNLNFVIFYVGKSAENWTLLFLLAKKIINIFFFFLLKSIFHWIPFCQRKKITS